MPLQESKITVDMVLPADLAKEASQFSFEVTVFRAGQLPISPRMSLEELGKVAFECTRPDTKPPS